MELPFLQNACVPDGKLTEYLLNPNHPKGRDKAQFFARFGYSQANAAELAAALVNHVQEHGIVREAPSPFGKRYVAEGPLDGMDGRRPNVRTVWFIESGNDRPRLISAYPMEEDDHD